MCTYIYIYIYIHIHIYTYIYTCIPDTLDTTRAATLRRGQGAGSRGQWGGGGGERKKNRLGTHGASTAKGRQEGGQSPPSGRGGAEG